MEITKDTRVSEVLKAHHGAATTFKRQGLFALMARMQGGSRDEITIAVACAQQGVDVEKLLEELRKEITVPAAAPSQAGGVIIHKKMKTTEVTNRYPATKAVFAKYFGKGCFDCPAFGTEDVAFACLMHNTDVNKFVKECTEAAQKGQGLRASG